MLNLKKLAIEAHKLSNNNRKLIKDDTRCGCFYCGHIFHGCDFGEDDWTDEPGENATMLCPECGIDSVIMDTEEITVTKELLTTMYEEWFV